MPLDDPNSACEASFGQIEYASFKRSRDLTQILKSDSITMPKVSVITPCYNSEKYVGQTLQSIGSQSFEDWEHIVVNDGSTDGSRTVVQSFAQQSSKIRLVEQTNGGMIGARITGFKAASLESSYLLFLDADDCAEPLMLERLVHYLDAHKEVGLVHTGYRFIDEKGNFTHYPEVKYRLVPHGLWLRKLPQDSPDTPFVSIFTLCVIISSISLIRRSVYEEVGGYDPAFGTHREDTDLFLRIALKSKVHFSPEPLIRRRRHGGQDTTSSPEFKQKSYLQTQKLYAKWRKGEGLTQDEKKLVQSAWRFKQSRVEPYQAFLRAAEYLKHKDWINAFRFYLGGLRRYLLSWIPGLDF